MIISKERIDSLSSIKKLTSYEDLNVFSMDIMYDYDLDKLTPVGVFDNDAFMNLIFEQAFPGMKLDMQAPNYGCSAFSLKKTDDGYIMGRNYDFKFDTSAMIVTCHPKNGYASIGHAALDNIKVVDPLESDTTKVACLASPFICLDGINEKGVGIAVLTLDSEPTVQNTGKKMLTTTILIRLVLDKAASTAEAVELIKNYDVFASSGRDYHFFITDNTGDSRVIEFDCDSPVRETVVTPLRTITNFYAAHIDKVISHQRNGHYGHGKERYDAIEAVLDANNGIGDYSVAWDALKASSQEPNPESITSNTQWSVAYDLNSLSYEFVLHRHWDDVIFCDTLKISTN